MRKVASPALHICVLQVLTPADEVHHINKHNFKVPFVCGCRDLGEALRRIAEGAAMIRTKVSSLSRQPGSIQWCVWVGVGVCSFQTISCASLNLCILSVSVDTVHAR